MSSMLFNYKKYTVKVAFLSDNLVICMCLNTKDSAESIFGFLKVKKERSVRQQIINLINLKRKKTQC